VGKARTFIYCEFCVFWVDDEGGMGRCQRHALVPSTTSKAGAMAVWPVTTGGDGCGDGALLPDLVDEDGGRHEPPPNA
jgi:hypothetical protein